MWSRPCRVSWSFLCVWSECHPSIWSEYHPGIWSECHPGVWSEYHPGVCDSLVLLSMATLGIEGINALSQTHALTLSRVWLYQDTGSSPSPQSGKTVLTTSKLVAFQIIILVSVLINTDLVTRSKPRLVNTVSDVIEPDLKTKTNHCVRCDWVRLENQD